MGYLWGTRSESHGLVSACPIPCYVRQDLGAVVGATLSFSGLIGGSLMLIHAGCLCWIPAFAGMTRNMLLSD